MSEGTSAPSAPRTETRRGVIFGVAALGAAVAGIPFFLTLMVNSDFGAWEVILATTLTNIGTTVLLAAVLFYLERNFTRNVNAVVTATTKTEVAAQTQDIRETTQDLRQRVEDIARELEERQQARAQTLNDAVTALRDNVTFDTVAELLEHANDLKALRYGSLTLPLGHGYESPRVQIFWGERHRSRFSAGNVFDDAKPEIVLLYEVPEREQEGGYTLAQCAWAYRMRAAEMLAELSAQMQTAGYVAAAAGVTPEVFKHLADALEEAMAARTGAPNTWMRGRLDEWITDGWAITDLGLESREGLRIAAEDFPDARFDAQPGGREPAARFEPERPDDVDAALWLLAVERARPKFTGSQGASIAASSWAPVPYTTETTPRKRDSWPPAE